MSGVYEKSAIKAISFLELNRKVCKQKLNEFDCAKLNYLYYDYGKLLLITERGKEEQRLIVDGQRVCTADRDWRMLRCVSTPYHVTVQFVNSWWDDHKAQLSLTCIKPGFDFLLFLKDYKIISGKVSDDIKDFFYDFETSLLPCHRGMSRLVCEKVQRIVYIDGDIGFKLKNGLTFIISQKDHLFQVIRDDKSEILKFDGYVYLRYFRPRLFRINLTELEVFLDKKKLGVPELF